MVALLLFLFPAGISLKIKDDYFKEELKNKDYIFLYMKYTSLINTLMFIVLFLYSRGVDVSMAASFDDLGFVFKYLVLSAVVAVIVPIIDEYVRKCVDLKINFKTVDEVKNVKKNK